MAPVAQAFRVHQVAAQPLPQASEVPCWGGWLQSLLLGGLLSWGGESFCVTVCSVVPSQAQEGGCLLPFPFSPVGSIRLRPLKAPGHVPWNPLNTLMDGEARGEGRSAALSSGLPHWGYGKGVEGTKPLPPSPSIPGVYRAPGRGPGWVEGCWGAIMGLWAAHLPPEAGGTGDVAEAGNRAQGDQFITNMHL